MSSRIGDVDLEVEDVDVGELLEEHPLAFHHRLRGQRPDVAEAEHRRAVRDHRDEVAARGVFARELGVAVDLEAGLGDPRRVGQAEVALARERLGGNDLDLPGPARAMEVEGILAARHGRGG